MPVLERDPRCLLCTYQGVLILLLSLHSGLSVIFLSLVSVSQLCVLPAENRDEGEGFPEAGRLQRWGHALVLLLSLGDIVRRNSRRDGVHAVSSSDGSRDFSHVLSGWEGSWLV